MTASSFNPFAGGVIRRVSPSTAPQREVIASSQLSDEANTGFNEAVCVAIEGAIDQDRMIRSFDALVRRHEAFQVTFSRKGDEMCLQEDIRARLHQIDLRGSSADEQQQYQSELARNIAISPMNLEEGPLVFAWLIQLAENRFSLMVAAHHVVCDGWTFGLILQELAEIYNQGGSDENLTDAPSFMDFAEQQDVGQIANTDIDYWLEQFAVVPPSLDLPLDKTRPAQRPFSATRYDYRIGSELTQSLRKTAVSQKASLVNTVLAAYITLLHRLTGNDDIVVGLPVAGQAALNQLQMAGHMVQLLPVRAQLDPLMSFADLLSQVKSAVLNASEHADFTFGTLVQNMKLDRSRVPLISTIFNIDQAMPPLMFGEAEARVASLPRAAENFELFLNIIPSDDDLVIEATYSTALFSEASIVSWLTALERILAQIVSDANTDLADFRLSDGLPLQVERINHTDCEFDDSGLLQRFYRFASQSPSQPAISVDGRQLNYQQLASGINTLAGKLATQNIGHGDIVGVCCRRSENLIIAALAIHQAGAAYVPLDPAFPADRLQYMLEDSGAVLLLGDDASLAGLGNTAIASMSLDQDLAIEIDAANAQPDEISIASEALAYIIYTSGSTGKPKGVKVSHGAMANFLASMAQRPGLQAGQSLLAVTTLAFDISILELFLPLFVGGHVVIAQEQDLKDGDAIASLIDLHNIDVMQATPAAWRLLMASAWRDRALNQRSMIALCGGEPLPRDLADMLLPRVAELWNMFGPTETTVWSTCKKITVADPVITVGTPIANTQIYILDDSLQPLPISVPGELYIGGQGVAVGYQNRDDLTQAAFLQHPQFGRIYRTGDLAKWTCDGELQHMGRLDDQVKIRGYRIELGEIEHAIVNTALVTSAAVYLWQVSDLDTRIVACCVAADNQSLPVSELRKQLRRALPAYMVPQYFIALDALPLTPNGKVNKRALPHPELAEASTILGGGSLESDTERALAAIWTEVIKPIRSLGREDNFFDVGGHSLLALEAIRQIEIQFGVTLLMTDLIQCKMAIIAELVDARASSAANSLEADSATPGLNAIALDSMAERRLSPDQRRCLQIQLNNPANTCFHLPAAWQLEGDLDVDGFLRAFRRVVQRQTALRTCIKARTDGDFFLGLLHSDDARWIDYQDLSVDDDASAIALNKVNAMVEQPFKLIDHPLLRATLFKLSEDRHLFFVCPNQLIFDGWSFDLLLKELEACYQSALNSEASQLDHLPLEYRDYCEWMTQRAAADSQSAHRAFHKQALNDAVFLNTAASAAHAGTDGRFTAGRRSHKLDAETLATAQSFCERQDLRIHELLVAVYANALVSQFRLPTVSIALPVTGRYNPSVIGLIGGFVSTLPFAVQSDMSAGFVAYCQRIAADLRSFHEHQDLSLAELLTDTGFAEKPAAAVMSASFAFQDIRNRPDSFANVSLAQVDIDRSQLEYPLEFWVRLEPQGATAVIDFDEQRVPAEQVQALLEQIVEQLQQLNALEASSPAVDTMQQSATKPSLWRKLFG